SSDICHTLTLNSQCLTQCTSSCHPSLSLSCFFFQAEDGIRDRNVTGVQTCALPISAVYSSHHRRRQREINHCPLDCFAADERSLYLLHQHRQLMCVVFLH